MAPKRKAKAQKGGKKKSRNTKIEKEKPAR